MDGGVAEVCEGLEEVGEELSGVGGAAWREFVLVLAEDSGPVVELDGFDAITVLFFEDVG